MLMGYAKIIQITPRKTICRYLSRKEKLYLGNQMLNIVKLTNLSIRKNKIKEALDKRLRIVNQ